MVIPNLLSRRRPTTNCNCKLYNWLDIFFSQILVHVCGRHRLRSATLGSRIGHHLVRNRCNECAVIATVVVDWPQLHRQLRYIKLGSAPLLPDRLSLVTSEEHFKAFGDMWQHFVGKNLPSAGKFRPLPQPHPQKRKDRSLGGGNVCVHLAKIWKYCFRLLPISPL
jgi:hypothetical protein